MPRARIYGADIDRDILFEEDRIKTAFVDQLDPSTLDALPGLLGQPSFDVIIDDGLHAIGANLNTLLFAMKHLNVGGYYVCEDIPRSADLYKVWTAIDTIVSTSGNFRTAMVQARHGFVYTLQRER